MLGFYLTYGHSYTRRSQVPQSFLVAHDPESTDDASQIAAPNNKAVGPTGYTLFSDDLITMGIPDSELVTRNLLDRSLIR